MNNNISRHLKGVVKGTDTYKKEIRVIAVMVICFMLCGAGLPAVKDKLPADGAFSDPLVAQEQTSGQPVSGSENSDKAKKDDAEKDGQSAQDAESGNGKDKKSSDNRKTGGTSGGKSGSHSSAASSSSSSSGKVWVPPVYKTVHHEAVYETRRVVICNYCGATFASTGEFQVHKDANGG